MSYLDGWETQPIGPADLADLEAAFPRFWWKDVFPGGRFQCKGREEKFRTIAESIRMAERMFQDGEREFHDGAFNRFFVSPGVAQSGWTYSQVRIFPWLATEPCHRANPIPKPMTRPN